MTFQEMLSFPHGKPFLHRRRRNSWRTRPFPSWFYHGLRRRLPYYPSGEHRWLLLELLGRQQFRHHTSADAVRRWHFVLEREELAWLAAHRRRGVVHLGRDHRQHAHLFSPHQSFRDHGHADLTCRRPG